MNIGSTWSVLDAGKEQETEQTRSLQDHTDDNNSDLGPQFVSESH